MGWIRSKARRCLWCHVIPWADKAGRHAQPGYRGFPFLGTRLLEESSRRPFLLSHLGTLSGRPSIVPREGRGRFPTRDLSVSNSGPVIPGKPRPGPAELCPTSASDSQPATRVALVRVLVQSRLQAAREDHRHVRASLQEGGQAATGEENRT